MHVVAPFLPFFRRHFFELLFSVLFDFRFFFRRQTLDHLASTGSYLLLLLFGHGLPLSVHLFVQCFAFFG